MNRFLKILFILCILILVILSGSMFTRFYFPKVERVDSLSIKKEAFQSSIQISILNSTKISGIASQARNFLREKGFDVVEIGNYETPNSKSIVIDRVGDFNSAKKVAAAAGLNDSSIVTELDSAKFLKCSLILGDDYKKLTPFRK